MLRARRTLVLAACGLAFAIPRACAQDDAAAKEAKKEEAALASAADELIKLARACESAKDVKDARLELELALLVTPDSKKVKDEVQKLSGKEDKPAPTWAAKLEK